MGKSKKSKDEIPENHENNSLEEMPKKKKKKKRDRVDEDGAPACGEGMVKVKVEGCGGAAVGEVGGGEGTVGNCRWSGGVGGEWRESGRKVDGTVLRIRDVTRHTGASKVRVSQPPTPQVGPLLPHFSHAPCLPAGLVAARPDITVTTGLASP